MIKNKYSNKLVTLLIFSVLLCLFGTVQASAAEPSRVTGLESSDSTPCARFGHGMVYDESNQQVVLFGGSAANDGRSSLADTWVFNCTSDTWLELNPTTRPSARSDHSMVYDSVNQQVILFGGWSDETWIFDPQSNQWTEVTSANHPSSRQSAGMYFDPVNQQVVLFGGYLNDDSHAGDTWIFDPATHTWTEVFPSSVPAARYGHSMVYDSVNQRGILFGGRVTALQSETWVYDYSSNSWTKLYPTLKPKARYWHGAAFDTDNESMILFGGDDEGPGRSSNDIWAFSSQDEGWVEFSPELEPVARIGHSLVYDSLNQRTLLFGGLGNDYKDSYGDTWAYDCLGSSWTHLVGPDYSNSSPSTSSSLSSTSSGAISTPGFGLSSIVISIGVISFLLVARKKSG
ncbi:MAG: Kelch repeat-containing protein [Candidatus Odinarchaeota archaeon]